MLISVTLRFTQTTRLALKQTELRSSTQNCLPEMFESNPTRKFFGDLMQMQNRTYKASFNLSDNDSVRQSKEFPNKRLPRRREVRCTES